MTMQGLESIQVRGLVHRYANFSLGPIDLDLGCTAVGLVGPNGAGKTTLMATIAGLLEGDEGSVSSGGRALDARNRRAAFSYSGLRTTWHRGLRLKDYLQVARVAYAAWDRDLERRWLDALQLSERLVPASASSGTQAKCSLLLALSRDAQVMLLDEPWNALDPNARFELSAFIESLARERRRAILISSHELAMLRFCDHIVFIRDGKIASERATQGVQTNLERVYREIYSP